MHNEVFKEAFNELFSHLERLETQSEAILQFLKEKKRVTDNQLAPYLEQAANASNVRWRAARVRIEHLLASADIEEPKAAKKTEEKPPEKSDSKQVAQHEQQQQGNDLPAGKEERPHPAQAKKQSGSQKNLSPDHSDSGGIKGQEKAAGDGKHDKEVKNAQQPDLKQDSGQPSASHPSTKDGIEPAQKPESERDKGDQKVA